jgi:ankyrin repeat protein
VTGRRNILRAALGAALFVCAAATDSQAGPSQDQALIAAAGQGDAAAVRKLLAEGASIAARDGQCRTALLAATHAAPGVGTEAARLLIAAGADLNSTNRQRRTALIPAAHPGHVETVRILLTTAIDKNHINNPGWTALLEAVILGDGGPAHTEIVRQLVAAGADVTIADRDGVTPINHARRRGFAAMAGILAAAG